MIQRLSVQAVRMEDGKRFYVEVWQTQDNGTARRLARAYVPAGEMEMRTKYLANELKEKGTASPILTAVFETLADLNAEPQSDV